MSQQPKIADSKPDIQTLEPGYYTWCSCGYSKTKTFCDGQHIRVGIMPSMFEITETKKVAICNCKHTKTPPYCDGSHKNLPNAAE